MNDDDDNDRGPGKLSTFLDGAKATRKKQVNVISHQDILLGNCIECLLNVKIRIQEYH